MAQLVEQIEVKIYQYKMCDVIWSKAEDEEKFVWCISNKQARHQVLAIFIAIIYIGWNFPC